MVVLRGRTLVFFLLTSLLFGGTYVAVKAASGSFPPLLFVALRYDIAAVVLLGYVALTRSSAELYPQTRGDVAGVVAAGVFALALTNGLLFVGQQYATSAVGAIVFSLSPVLTPLFAAVLLSDEQLTLHGMAGTTLGLLGVALVAGLDPAALLGGSSVGVAILFAGAVSAALGGVLVRRADASLSSTVRVAWALPLSAVILHVASPLMGESVSEVALTPTAVASLVYLSVFAGAVAYVSYFGLLADVGATKASLTFYVSPVVATLGGWALLGESVAATTALGFAVIVVGFALVGAPTLSAALPSTPSLPAGVRGEQEGQHTTDRGQHESPYGAGQD